MTREEKARAYDEALEDMRVIYPNLRGDAKLAVEHAFPELAESEDERIRKELIIFILYRAGRVLLDKETEHRFVAYLEKQKDLTTENIYKHSRERMSFWNEKQKEQKPAESISQLTVQGKGVYKICPRCKERMIRDDSMVYTSMPPQYRYECPKCGESECDTVMYDNPEMEEHKPAEWSEDELGRKHLEGYIMGREDTMREMKDFIESHFNCENAKKDTPIVYNTQSGTSTLKAEG